MIDIYSEREEQYYLDLRINGVGNPSVVIVNTNGEIVRNVLSFTDGGIELHEDLVPEELGVAKIYHAETPKYTRWGTPEAEASIVDYKLVVSGPFEMSCRDLYSMALAIINKA